METLPNPAWVTAKYEESGILYRDGVVDLLDNYPPTKYSIELWGPDERGFFIYVLKEL